MGAQKQQCTCFLADLLRPFIGEHREGVAGEGDGTSLPAQSCPQQGTVDPIDDSWQAVNGCLVDQHCIVQQCVLVQNLQEHRKTTWVRCKLLLGS